MADLLRRRGNLWMRRKPRQLLRYLAGTRVRGRSLSPDGSRTTQKQGRGDGGRKLNLCPVQARFYLVVAVVATVIVSFSRQRCRRHKAWSATFRLASPTSSCPALTPPF